MKIACKFFITGRVQGVGFRYFTQRIAAKHQVTGYVKNLTDGRVEAFAEGTRTDIENFKLDLATGPAFSRVEGIEEIVCEPTNAYPSFRIER